MSKSFTLLSLGLSVHLLINTLKGLCTTAPGCIWLLLKRLIATFPFFPFPEAPAMWNHQENERNWQHLTAEIVLLKVLKTEKKKKGFVESTCLKGNLEEKRQAFVHFSLTSTGTAGVHHFPRTNSKILAPQVEQEIVPSSEQGGRTSGVQGREHRCQGVCCYPHPVTVTTHSAVHLS